MMAVNVKSIFYSENLKFFMKEKLRCSFIGVPYSRSDFWVGPKSCLYALNELTSQLWLVLQNFSPKTPMHWTQRMSSISPPRVLSQAMLRDH